MDSYAAALFIARAFNRRVQLRAHVQRCNSVAIQSNWLPSRSSLPQLQQLHMLVVVKYNLVKILVQ